MLKSWLVATFTLIASISAGAAPFCNHLTFEGEVRGDTSYSQPLGMGLVFRMEALKDHWGWTYEIGPTDAGQDEFNSYIYALNPPYRGKTITNLSIQYSTPAQEAVGKNDREFWFLVSRTEGATAGEALNDILWPKNDDAQQAAFAKLGTLKMGTGVLRVIDADFDPGTSKSGDESSQAYYGAIYRISFRVELAVPPGFKPEPSLHISRGTCPDPKEWPR